jgi:hypothetical protein
MKKLNDLPKDILIKLVTVIEEKTQKRCEKEFFDKGLI